MSRAVLCVVVVADAISCPRRPSATEYARAAMATRAAQDGRLAVTAVHEDGKGAVLGHLVVRVHLDALDDQAAFSRAEPAVTT